MLNLRYGSSNINLDTLLDKSRIIKTKKVLPPLRDVYRIFKHSIEHPINLTSFDDFFSKSKSVCIVLPDITRLAGSAILVPIILNRLREVGIKNKNVKVLFATGIHRNMTFEEKISIVGRTIAQKVNLLDHNPYKENKFAGRIGCGLEVYLNKNLFDIDAIILISAINFHYLAGFGGGMKLILPGCASYESCVEFHKLSYYKKSSDRRHPKTRPGVVVGNPLRKASNEVAKFLPPIFSINTIIVREKIAAIFSGHYDSAFQKAVNFYKKYFLIKLDKQVDAVVASCGGFPKDINFIQSHKSIEHTVGILKEGGLLILFAECKDGLGREDFMKWFRFKNIKEFEIILEKNFEVNGFTAFAALQKAKKYNIYLFTSLEKGIVEKMSMKKLEKTADIKTILKGNYLIIENASSYLFKV